MNTLPVNQGLLSQFNNKYAQGFKGRSIEEQVLLALCVTGFLGIFPFAIYRAFNAQWLLSFIDSALLTGVLFIGTYVWVTRKVGVASRILTLFYMSGMIAVIYVHGPSLLFWAFPTMAAVYFLIRPHEAAIINAIAMLALMPVLVELKEIEGQVILVTLILNNIFAYIFSKRMRLHTNRLVKEATKDTLTGIDNRKLYNEKAKEKLAWHRRKGEVSTLMIFDVDHFKKINDQFGHVKGDEVLVNLVAIIKNRLRITDHIFRLGGEEFAILLPDTKAEIAAVLAEELRKLIETSVLVDNYPVTISLGLSQCHKEDTEIEWFKRADLALYQAKNTGRNKVVFDHSIATELENR